MQEHLSELERKLDYLEQNESVRETAAYADVAPELERLRIKAITRVREFIMTRWGLDFLCLDCFTTIMAVIHTHLVGWLYVCL